MSPRQNKKSAAEHRRRWLCGCAPFRVVPATDIYLGLDGCLQISDARARSWMEQQVTHCVIDRHGQHWVTFNARSPGTADEYAKALNDESLLAIITEGTEAEKLI